MKPAFLIWMLVIPLTYSASCGGKVVIDGTTDDGAEAMCAAFCANTAVLCDSGAGGGGFPLQLTANATGCLAVEMAGGEMIVLSIDCAAHELCNAMSGNCDDATFSATGATLPLGASGMAECKP